MFGTVLGITIFILYCKFRKPLFLNQILEESKNAKKENRKRKQYETKPKQPSTLLASESDVDMKSFMQTISNSKNMGASLLYANPGEEELSEQSKTIRDICCQNTKERSDFDSWNSASCDIEKHTERKPVGDGRPVIVSAQENQNDDTYNSDTSEWGGQSFYDVIGTNNANREGKASETNREIMPETNNGTETISEKRIEIRIAPNAVLSAKNQQQDNLKLQNEITTEPKENIPASNLPVKRKRGRPPKNKTTEER